MIANNVNLTKNRHEKNYLFLTLNNALNFCTKVTKSFNDYKKKIIKYFYLN